MNKKKTLRLVLALVLALMMVVPAISIPATMTASAALPTAEELAETTTYVSEDFESQEHEYLLGGALAPSSLKTTKILSEEGHGKFLRVPIVGTLDYVAPSNYDRSAILANPAVSYTDGFITYEADYRPHYDSTVGGDPLVEVQVHPISYTASDGSAASANYMSFFQIRLSNGELCNTLGGTRGPASNLTLDAWNHIQIVLDLASGTYTVLVNGEVYAYNCQIANGYKDAGIRFASIAASKLIIAKVNKQNSAFQQDYAAENYSYIDLDNVAFRTATASEKALCALECTDGQTGITVAQTYKTQNGDYVRVPFIGTATATSGTNGSGNYDKSVTLNNNVISSIHGSVVFEAKYRPHYVALSKDSSAANYCGYSVSTVDDPTVELQAYGNYRTAAGGTAHQNWLTFGYINLRTGAITGNHGGVLTGEPGMTLDQWNTLKLVMNLAAGTFSIYVNGNLYLYDGKISNSQSALGTEFSLDANTFTIAKNNKNRGAYLDPSLAEAGRDYSYIDIDDISLRTPTKAIVTLNGVEYETVVDAAFTIEKSGCTFISAVVTDKNGTRTVTNDTIVIAGDTTITATFKKGVTYIEKDFESNTVGAAESGNAGDLKRSITLQENGNKFLRVPFVGGADYANDSNWDQALKVRNAAVPSGELIEISEKFRAHKSASYGTTRFQVQAANYNYTDSTGASKSGSWLGIFELNLNASDVSVTSENASGFGFVEGQSGNLEYDRWYTITAQFDTAQNRITIFVDGVAYKTGSISSAKLPIGSTNFSLPANTLIVAKCNKYASGYAPASTDLATGDYSYVDIDDVNIFIPAKVEVTIDGGTPVEVANNSYYTIEKAGYTFVSAVVTDLAGTRTVYNDTILLNGDTDITVTWRTGEYYLIENFEDEALGEAYTGSTNHTLKVSKVYREGGDQYLRIPFIGGEGAYTDDSNWDRTLMLNHKAAPFGSRLYLVGKYRPHQSENYANTTVQAQIADYSVYDVDAEVTRHCSFFALFTINLKDGSLGNESGSVVKTGAPGLTMDEWNDIAVLIDTSTLQAEVYVNGLLYMTNNPKIQYWVDGEWKYVANATNFSIYADSLSLAKCNKVNGAFAPVGTNMDTGDYSYVDVDDFEVTKETDSVMVDITVNGEARKIIPGTSFACQSTAEEFFLGASVNSGDATYYPEYKQIVVGGTANITLNYSKTGASENFEGKTVGDSYRGAGTVGGNGPSSAVVAEMDGNKYVRIALAPGASNNPSAGDENVDRNLAFASPELPYRVGVQNVVLSAKYYIEPDSKGSLQSQYFSLKGNKSTMSWLSLYSIDAETGMITRNPGWNDNAKYVPIGEWFTVDTVMDLATGDVYVFVNGACVLEFSIGQGGITLNANAWVVAKVNKTSSADNLAGGFGVDDVKETLGGENVTYTLNGVAKAAKTGDVIDLDEAGNLLTATIAIGGGDPVTLATTKVLALNGLTVTTTLFDPETIGIEMVGGAAVRFSNPTGLRYTAVLDADTVALLDGYLASGAIKGAKLGMMIAPTAFVQSAEAFTMEALDELGEGKYVTILTEYGDWLNNESGKFAGALVGIKANHLNKSYSGLAYLIVTLMSGNEVVVYADYDETNARTVAGVAQAAIDAGDFLGDTEKVILQSFLPVSESDAARISGYLTSSTVISELHATNTAIYFKYNGSYIRLTYTGNYGFRIQANRTGWNDFNDIGAAQALAFAAGDDLDEGNSQHLERIWIESGDATCIRIRGGNNSKDSNTTNRPYIKLDSNGTSFGMTINNGDNNYTVAATGEKGANIGSVNSISYSNGTFTITGGLTSTEGIYGGGETLQSLNKRGKSLSLYTSDGYNDPNRTYCTIPFFTTTRGLGIFMNRYERGTFSSSASGSSGTWTLTVDNDLLDCYIFASGSMKASISAYTDLTGHADLPPEWSDGALICRYGPDNGVLRGIAASGKDGYTYLGDGIVDIVINYIEAGAKMNAVIFEGVSAAQFFRTTQNDTRVIADRDANGNLQYNTNNTVNVNGKAVKYDLKVKTVTEPGSSVQMWRDIIEYLHSLDIRCMVYMTPGSHSVVGLSTSSPYLAHVNMYKNGELIGENLTGIAKVSINSSKGTLVSATDYVVKDTTEATPTGGSAMYYLDITNDEAVEWYFNTMWAQLIDLGIDGVKIDFCEEMPDTGVTYYSGSDQYTFTYNWADPSKLYTPDTGSEHHAYATLFNTMFYKFANAYADTVEGQDGFIILARGGGIGSQRNPYMWAGDQYRDWNAGSRQLLSLLTYGVSGVPFTTYDMAGYQYGINSVASTSKPTVGALADTTYYKRVGTMTIAVESQEFSRSVEYTAFTNNIQTHGYVRHWYELDSNAQNIYKKYMALHNSTAMQALLDYYQQKAVDTGVPVVRPLVLNFQNDSSTYSVENQFMLGDALLVCPILESGKTSRSVYLPSNTNGWIAMNSTAGTTVTGGRSITGNAAYDKILVFLNKDLETTDPTAYALASAVFNSTEWRNIITASNVTSFGSSTYSSWRVVSPGVHTYN